MAENSKIEWTDHTFNPWIGCSKVHTGCLHCYAEADMDRRRHFAQWGPHGTRVKTSDHNWKLPLKWNREAETIGERHRVFCASLADVFEPWEKPVLNTHGQYGIKQGSPVEYAWQSSPVGGFGFPSNCVTLDDLRWDLFELIDKTPCLDWLVLTKRPERIISTIAPNTPYDDAEELTQYYRHNTWFGTSISDQATANKAIPDLLWSRPLAPVLFLSVEPLVGRVDLTKLANGRGETYDALRASVTTAHGHTFTTSDRRPIDWVIVGGESGPNARPCDVNWIRDIVRQCRSAGVPCFVKQLGAVAALTQFDGLLDWPEHVEYRKDLDATNILLLRDKKGGDPAEWPEDLRVRQIPRGHCS